MLHLPRGRTGRITLATLVVAALTGGIAVAAVPSSSDGPEAPPPVRNLRVSAPTAIPQAGYVSLAPCRIADTRKAVGAVGKNQTRRFVVGGTTGFAPQGGTSGGCGVPVGASSVALAVTTTGAAGTGYLTFFADGAARPASNQTSYGAGGSVTTLVNAPVNATTGKVAVFAAQKTHVLLDVAGYYREPIAARIDATGTLGVHSNQITASAHGSTGYYTVTVNQPIGDCIIGVVAQTSQYNAAANATSSSTRVDVYVRDVTATNSPYADSGFDLTLTC